MIEAKKHNTYTIFKTKLKIVTKSWNKPSADTIPDVEVFSLNSVIFLLITEFVCSERVGTLMQVYSSVFLRHNK